MTITSVGYAGTVGEVQWSNMIPRVGSTFYSVDDYASFRVTVTAGTRAVSVAAGGASAVGVYDVSNAAATLNLGSVSSGDRWDLVVLRRNWSTKLTTLVVIQGSATKTIPARNTTVGTLHDQPIALCRVTSSTGSAVVQEIVDLRCVGGDGGLTAFDDLSRSYLSRVGTQVRIGNTLWTRTIDALGSPLWAAQDVTPDTGWLSASQNDGWTWGLAQVRRIGGTVFYRFNASRAAGWSNGNELASGIPSSCRPAVAWYAASSSSAGKTEWQITTSGTVLASQDSGGATGVSIFGSYPAA